ncbi:MAG: DUF86 domain-containing protein [Calditrichia bacterium]
MLESIDKIADYVSALDFDDFKFDSKTIDAVVRNFEIIGEAARNIPPSIKKQYADVPWQDVVDFRNRIAHEYFNISLEIVWQIIQKELPKLKTQLIQILNRSKG